MHLDLDRLLRFVGRGNKRLRGLVQRVAVGDERLKCVAPSLNVFYPNRKIGTVTFAPVAVRGVERKFFLEEQHPRKSRVTIEHTYQHNTSAASCKRCRFAECVASATNCLDDHIDMLGSHRILQRRNSFGLLSEDADLETGELWGNFPQTYSMVGLINSAMRLSRNWEEAF